MNLTKKNYFNTIQTNIVCLPILNLYIELGLEIHILHLFNKHGAPHSMSASDFTFTLQ